MFNARILVVEDESIVAMDIQDTLKHLGYTVPATAASGEEAIKKSVETHPDLVLMDINLQGKMDGVEAANQIFSRCNIPVIYLTAYGDDDTLARAKVTEPFGYILKPFQERDLCTSIEVGLYKHQMQQKLAEHDQWLATILSGISDAVIATDANRLVTFMNPVAETLTGWKQEDAMGREIVEVFQLMNEHNRVRVESLASSAIQEGATTNRQNQIIFTKDGAEIPIDDSAGPLKDHLGNIQGAVFVFRDITERKQEEEVKAFSLQVEQSNSELQTLIYVTSHVLPPSLRKIQLYGDRLKSDAKTLNAQGQENLERMQRAAGTLEILINDLLAFYRVALQELRFAPVDLAKLAQEILSDLAEHGEQIDGRVQVDSLPTIEADPLQMRELLQHLLSNALKFSRPKEAPAVKVQGQLLKRQEPGHSSQGESGHLHSNKVSPWNVEQCQITIEDNGIGFDEKYLERIFELFQRLHGTGEYEGTGVGLAACRNIVQRHNGAITARSVPDQGSTFIVTLPVTQSR